MVLSAAGLRMHLVISIRFGMRMKIIRLCCCNAEIELIILNTKLTTNDTVLSMHIDKNYVLQK